jgi:hypothetical protein
MKTIFTLFILHLSVYAKVTVKPGLEISKSHNYHWNNGFSGEVHWNEFTYVSGRFKFLSSQIGSALNSHALEEDYYLASFNFFSRPETWFNPYLEIETGYFTTHIPEKEFSYLETSSQIFNVQLGLRCHLQKIPLGVDLYLGYHLIQSANNLFPAFTGMRFWYAFNI